MGVASANGGRSLWPPCLQGFNTKVTEILRALRVEVLIDTEYAEPMRGGDMLIRRRKLRCLSS